MIPMIGILRRGDTDSAESSTSTVGSVASSCFLVVGFGRLDPILGKAGLVLLNGPAIWDELNTLRKRFETKFKDSYLWD